MREERAKTAEASDSLVEVFSYPLIAVLGAWGDTLPDWIKSPKVVRRHPAPRVLFTRLAAIKGGIRCSTYGSETSCLRAIFVNKTSPSP